MVSFLLLILNYSVHICQVKTIWLKNTESLKDVNYAIVLQTMNLVQPKEWMIMLDIS